MNRLIITMVAAVWIAGSITAQDVPSQSEFNKVFSDWFEFNNRDKEAAYAIMGELNDKISKEFPMDPELVKTLEERAAKSQAAIDEEAKALGYSNFKDALSSNDPKTAELKKMFEQMQTEGMNLTAPYYEELTRRINAAAIEAIRRLMENAEAMKK